LKFKEPEAANPSPCSESRRTVDAQSSNHQVRCTDAAADVSSRCLQAQFAKPSSIDAVSSLVSLARAATEIEKMKDKKR
jgi:hypothetical protein